jgi:hypothetical protein
LQIGDVLEKGDRIKTAGNSRCDIVMDEKGQQKIGIFDNSEVIVLLGKTEKFELVNANVLFSLEGLPKGTTFEVKTPTAVCGVRGTGFKIFADTTSTQINAYFNSVYGKNFQGVVKDIPPGYFRTINKNGNISKLLKIPNMSTKRFRAWKKSSGEKKEKKDKSDRRTRNFRFEKKNNLGDNTRGKTDKKNTFKKDQEKIADKPSCPVSPPQHEIPETPPSNDIGGGMDQY